MIRLRRPADRGWWACSRSQRRSRSRSGRSPTASTSHSTAPTPAAPAGTLPTVDLGEPRRAPLITDAGSISLPGADHQAGPRARLRVGGAAGRAGGAAHRRARRTRSSRACRRIARPVQLGPDGYPERWGDPYVGFVGDVNGYEPSFTGYGVYYPPIVAAAERYGARRSDGTGWTIPEIVAQLRAGNSVVVWLTSDFKPHVPRYWTAWDGRADPVGDRRARRAGDRVRPGPRHDHVRRRAVRGRAYHSAPRRSRPR